MNTVEDLTGTAEVVESELVGIAETQVVVSTVPGIDPAFAFIPRTTTTRMAWSPAASRSAASNCSRKGGCCALRASGRSRTTVATAPSVSY